MEVVVTGEAIRALRGEMGLSRAEFCRLLGTRWETVWRWETNRTRPQPIWLRELERLARTSTAATTADNETAA